MPKGIKGFQKGHKHSEETKRNIVELRKEARRILNHAIRDGKIKRMPCEVCWECIGCGRMVKKPLNFCEECLRGQG